MRNKGRVARSSGQVNIMSYPDESIVLKFNPSELELFQNLFPNHFTWFWTNPKPRNSFLSIVSKMTKIASPEPL